MANTHIKLTVNPEKRLSQVRQEFNSRFPYLKLEFFRKKHEMPGRRRDIIHEDIPLKQLVRIQAPELEITPDMPVYMLEQLFSEKFKVFVQVFRKSGNTWLETSRTDDWTLDFQNEQGRELSRFAG